MSLTILLSLTFHSELHGEQGTLVLDVRDLYGQPVTEFEVKAAQLALRYDAGDPKELRLPHGVHELTIVARGFSAVSKTVEIRQPLLRLLVGLPLGEIGGGGLSFTLDGKVDAPLDFLRGGAFVRVVSVYGDVNMSVFLNEQGEFTAEVRREGAYIVSLFIQGKMRTSEIAVVKYGERFIRLHL